MKLKTLLFSSTTLSTMAEKDIHVAGSNLLEGWESWDTRIDNIGPFHMYT